MSQGAASRVAAQVLPLAAPVEMSRMVRSTEEVVVMACSFIRGRGLARGRWITGRSGARCRRGGWTHRGDTGGGGGVWRGGGGSQAGQGPVGGEVDGLIVAIQAGGAVAAAGPEFVGGHQPTRALHLTAEVRGVQGALQHGLVDASQLGEGEGLPQ